MHGRDKNADRVMLNRKNLCTKRPMEKLENKMFRPFVVKRKVGSRAYEIERPGTWDIHPVFHLSQLELYREDPVGRPQKIIPTPDIVDNEPSYVGAEVVDSRWYGNPKSKSPNRFIQFMVAWEGYGPEQNSWEPFKILQDTARQALQQFNERYPSKHRNHRVMDNPNRGSKRRG